MNLYEIDARITEAFEAAVDPETGEIINQEAYEALDGLQMEMSRKVEGVLLWIKNLRADAEALKAERQAFASRQQSAERKADSLEKYISGILNGQKFSTERVAVTWRKSKMVEFTGNLKELPSNLVREKLEINKTAIKDALEHGMDIPGASIVIHNNMQIK